MGISTFFGICTFAFLCLFLISVIVEANNPNNPASKIKVGDVYGGTNPGRVKPKESPNPFVWMERVLEVDDSDKTVFVQYLSLDANGDVVKGVGSWRRQSEMTGKKLSE